MQDDLWRRRFLAPEVGGVRWSTAVPDRLAVVSTEGGATGAWAWDLATGGRLRVSGTSAGTEEALVTPDGGAVVWWLDALGDERGRWMVSPFDGGTARSLLPDMPDAWAAGVSLVPGVAAAGFSTDEDYVIVVSRDGGPAREVYRHRQPAGVGCEWPQGEGGLSADGRLLCIRHAEHSDFAHPELRILDVSAAGDAAQVGADAAPAGGGPGPAGGEPIPTVGDLHDPGRLLVPAAWSPIPGDQRLVVVRELGDRARPWTWDLVTGELREVVLDLAGDVARAWWYPDGAALLVHHELDATASLHRVDLASGLRTTVVEAAGTIDDAGVRPDGTVWYRREDGSSPPSWLTAEGEHAVTLPGDPAPPGGHWESIWFTNPGGDRIQGWLLRPTAGAPTTGGAPAAGPYPVIVNPHGGPEWHVSDRWDPLAQAYADHGYAVFAVNYRGSTGYGRAFREVLHGNIGFPESEDLVAGLDHLVALGIADPARAFIEGWSWGGYLATLNAGLHPKRWRGVVAGIPVGDLVAAHYECAPILRAWDVATLGGDPLELPELYHERNPMTYVDRVTAPVLLIAGEHDSRCPLGQVMVYAHALRRRGRPVEVELYPEGHHANRVEERIRHAELILDFLARCSAAEPAGAPTLPA